jgi:hypothetical protein
MITKQREREREINLTAVAKLYICSQWNVRLVMRFYLSCKGETEEKKLNRVRFSNIIFQSDPKFHNTTTTQNSGQENAKNVKQNKCLADLRPIARAIKRE